MSAQFDEKLKGLLARYEELGNKLSEPNLDSSEYPKLSKERSDLEEVAELAQQYIKLSSDIEQMNEMLKGESLDDEMKQLMGIELEEANSTMEGLENKIKLELIPKDADDEKNAILEVRAGTGGDEAALFAAVLFRMYSKYAERHRWKFEIISLSETGLDGYKEATAIISGKGVFARMKFESGVHRVQRIPETESNGRIHTSAATVAVLPEAEEVDVEINESDLKIDVYRASGAGGQHVNTTESAVRITHIPTGIVVIQQDERSQHKNKARAMKVLRSRLYEVERQKKQFERSAMRRGQVGSGDRSERIRTYNYPQGRVTDHRVHVTLYGLDKVTNEGEFDVIVDALIAADSMEKLTNLE